MLLYSDCPSVGLFALGMHALCTLTSAHSMCTRCTYTHIRTCTDGGSGFVHHCMAIVAGETTVERLHAETSIQVSEVEHVCLGSDCGGSVRV